MAVYTFTNLLDAVAYPNQPQASDARTFLNRAVRMVLADVDTRGTRRRSQITPGLFDDIYDYSCPTDMKAEAIIDIIPQANRTTAHRWRLASGEEFDRKKASDKHMVSFGEDDLVRKLRLSIDADDTTATISHLESLTDGGGTWSVYSDAANIAVDETYFVEGSASLRFDLTGSATTAGIQNTTLTAFDITDYINSGSIFVWVFINSTTNLTNFILNIGNDLTTNYYSQTVTTTNEGVAFQNGWNLLRFDFASMTQTGTVTPTTVDSVRLYMTKSSGKSDDGYRVDSITLHTSEIMDAAYYSKYGWQTNTGTWIENSTATTDLLNCDTDEFDLFVMRGKVEMYRELREWDQAKDAREEYKDVRMKYARQNPSQRMKRQINYY